MATIARATPMVVLSITTRPVVREHIAKPVENSHSGTSRRNCRLSISCKCARAIANRNESNPN